MNEAQGCAFCGGGPLSQEHVLPKWSLEVFELGSATVTRESVRHDRKRDGWVISGVESTVRRVCASCNSGWMSRLETRSAPIVKPLLKSPASRTLQDSELDVLAVWATKTVLVADLMIERRRDPPIIQEGQYSWFYESQESFPNSLAWVGGFDLGDRSAFSVSTNLIGATRSGIWRSTLNVGCLVYVLMVLPGAPDELIADAALAGVPEEFRPFLIPLYPRDQPSLRWPGPEVMDEDTLHALSGLPKATWATWPEGED